MAQSVGQGIVARGGRLVYGGGRVGLMGVIAQSVRAAGGDVIGIIPEMLSGVEIAYAGCTELILTQTMAERKTLLAQKADAFLALPGGFGTLDELFESLTEAQLGLHTKPIGLLNTRGFFDPLLAWIDRSVTEGFLKPKYGLRPVDSPAMWIVSNDVDEILDHLLKPR
jgi:uncharacterized protein (TIGR00730 family)